MNKILVIGGCGYIGSHISRAIKQHKVTDQVFVIDRVRRDHTLKNVNSYLIDDYASKQSLMWVEKLNPDVIIHCAGSSLVGDSIINPADYYENNIAKTAKLLTHVKNFVRPPLILFSSSASVYGNPISDVLLLESSPKSPISPYGFSKYVIEHMLSDYYNAYGIPSVCFRYFNAAGAEPVNYDLGQTPGATHIIARILEAKLNKQPFILNGNDYNTPDRTCIRDYIHVWDLADAHIRAIEWMQGSDKKSAIVMNLGTDNGISNKEIIDYVISKHGELKIVLGTRRDGDPDKLVADSTLARKCLSWTPTHSSLDSIIDSAYQWYTNWYRTNDV